MNREPTIGEALIFILVVTYFLLGGAAVIWTVISYPPPSTLYACAAYLFSIPIFLASIIYIVEMRMK